MRRPASTSASLACTFKNLLAQAIVVAFAVGVVLLASAAQEENVPDASLPVFEVASVKPNASGSDGSSWSGAIKPLLSGTEKPSPERIAIRNATVRDLIARAYGLGSLLDRFLLTGGLDNILQARFDIVATQPDGAPLGQAHLMLRRLLIERFGLRLHTELQQRPLYALTVLQDGHLGPHLRASLKDCEAFLKQRRIDPSTVEPVDDTGHPLCFGSYHFNAGARGDTLVRNAGYVERLLEQLQPALDRPLIDETNLNGTFEWRFFYSARNGTDSQAPPIFTAVQRDLGLKLERRTGPLRVYIVDDVRMPTPD